MKDTEQPNDLPEQEAYVPRKRWQVWAARIALLVFIAFIIMYYIIIFRGGN